MILYHRTARDIAEQTLRDGFRDGVGQYLTDQEWSGVWLSDLPLDCSDGVEGDTLLGVTLSEDSITQYEWIEEGKWYREWLVPAQLINKLGTVHLIGDEADGNWRGQP